MVSEVVVYRGDSKLTTTEVTKEEIGRGVTMIECPACEGTGVFWITEDHSQSCVECSTRGEVDVSI